MEESAAGAVAPEFDVYGAMDWTDGVGTLPGSELKFRVNEFGVLEVITDEAEAECVKKAHATTTWAVPTAQEGKHVLSKKADRKTMRGPNRGRRKRRGDAALLRHTVPCGGKRKAWCWASYLEQEKAVAAPTKLFKEHQSFPQSKNGFRVGMKLEGVDPEHPSMYCVLTVVEVSGHRIRLHFDKYSDCYDFWVNSNSPDIHPVGWCEKTGHKPYPPKGLKDEEFNWPSYIKLCKAQAAPKALFENQNTTVTPSGFRIGMKLEAVDKKNPTFICVATVTDMVDSRFLVHFDNWDESYDYWCDATSPYIHPVDWCQKNGKILTAPPGYHNAKNFSWEKYLEETNSLPAPARAFKVKPPHSFQKHMKLEAVDKRNPMLIRVCTVIDTDDHRIRIHFDGWTDEYDYWVDADSADIHPAGWCAKTGHPLQPPISPQEVQTICPTPGCKGVGHIKGARYSGHHSAVGCPYSDINVNKDSFLPDRLSGEMPATISVVVRTRRGESVPDIASFASELGHTRHSSVYMSFSPSASAPFCWDQHSKLLPTVAGITASKVAEWSVEQVSRPTLSSIVCWNEWKMTKFFCFFQQIDGEAFLLLTQVDLVKIMSIKLGPALKIYNSILMFKTAEDSYNEL
uniref:L3MBTL histone methyl-lysine binding protein 3 n=1 Tax=Scleropages formosus TaxID=113540 RepID=A0A8C9TUV1_SCLFO